LPAAHPARGARYLARIASLVEFDDDAIE